MKRIFLAFELYGASGFEKSSRSRFLTLMLSLESMIKQKERPPEIINVIKDLAKSIDTMDLNSDEKQSIKNGISMLKKESISKSGQHLSATFLDSKKYIELDPSIGRFAPFGCNFSNIIFDVFRFV